MLNIYVFTLDIDYVTGTMLVAAESIIAAESLINNGNHSYGFSWSYLERLYGATYEGNSKIIFCTL